MERPPADLVRTEQVVSWGVGPITASARLATITDPTIFRSGAISQRGSAWCRASMTRSPDRSCSSCRRTRSRDGSRRPVCLQARQVAVQSSTCETIGPKIALGSCASGNAIDKIRSNHATQDARLNLLNHPIEQRVRSPISAPSHIKMPLRFAALNVDERTIAGLRLLKSFLKLRVKPHRDQLIAFAERLVEEEAKHLAEPGN
jgi:hypothetical protein